LTFEGIRRIVEDRHDAGGYRGEDTKAGHAKASSAIEAGSSEDPSSGEHV